MTVPVPHPDMADFDGICPKCGDIMTRPFTKVTHEKFRAAKVIIEVCEWCAEQSMCTGNMYGIHGEVYAMDDDEFWLTKWPYPMGKGIIPSQWGQCSVCWQPMRWDVEKQRWRDVQAEVP